MPVDVDYFDHPKTLRLVAALGNGADVLPLRIWKHCVLYAKDGRLQLDEVEAIARWWGKRGELIRALVRFRLVDKDGDQVVVHDWMDWTGQDVAAYEVKKKTAREYYRKKHGILPEAFQKVDTSLSPSQSSPDLSQTSPEPTREKTPREMGDNPQDMTTHHLMQIAAKAKCPNNEATVRKHIEALINRSDVGAEKLEAYLMSPDARGQDVIAWGNHFRPVNGKPAKAEPKPPPVKHYFADGTWEMRP